MELFVVVFLFGLACANSSRSENDLRRIDSIYSEPGCSSAGGICTVDCPSGHLAKPGLCPQQQNQGVECCYGISEKETRCQRLGGECFTLERSCRKYLIVNQAKDCDQGYVCCLLL